MVETVGMPFSLNFHFCISDCLKGFFTSDMICITDQFELETGAYQV